jgi:hypothetical protein
MAKVAVFAAAIPALVLGASGVASADGNVTWVNAKWSGYRLGNSGGKVFLGNATFSWHDVQNSDGSWNEVSNLDGQCLTGYYTQIYTEPCNSGKDGTNWWERWYEVSTNSGWKLKNRETGYILDAGDPGNVYGNATDYGDGDPNQRWH